MSVFVSATAVIVKLHLIVWRARRRNLLKQQASFHVQDPSEEQVRFGLHDVVQAGVLKQQRCGIQDRWDINYIQTRKMASTLLLLLFEDIPWTIISTTFLFFLYQSMWECVVNGDVYGTCKSSMVSTGRFRILILSLFTSVAFLSFKCFKAAQIPDIWSARRQLQKDEKFLQLRQKQFDLRVAELQTQQQQRRHLYPSGACCRMLVSHDVV